MRNPLKFFQEVKQEAFKVTWPTGKETVQGTIMVAIMAIIASLFFLLIDQFYKFFLDIINIAIQVKNTINLIVKSESAKTPAGNIIILPSNAAKVE